MLHPAWHFTWCTLHISLISRVTISSLDIFLFQFGTSVVPCRVLTVASWPVHRFLRRPVRWSGIPISLRISHSLLWSTQSKIFSVVNKAEVDVFLELSCFFYDPVDVGNLTSGSSAFSKSNLYIWKFLVTCLFYFPTRMPEGIILHDSIFFRKIYVFGCFGSLSWHMGIRCAMWGV